ncbi:MAG TPA: abortive infection system antitoxin AbiGi family protein [Nitrososphaera sp.]|nr:abortive infection system antitoxin AbiGi family protein [Nitrososphaera sp.]
MAVSASTLFHFTGNLENLINILANEFHPRFCLEEFKDVFAGKNPPIETLELAVPMVCFCDLPLSQTEAHLSVYGDYGIGMTKSWGQRNGITPVLYVHRESLLISKFGQLLGQVSKENPRSDFRGELSNHLYDLACFIKPYEGNIWRRGEQRNDIRFYDEREWRYVPVLPDDDPYRKGMPKSDFLNDRIREAANNKLTEISRISFEPNDIKYLIVRLEEEIVPFIREIEYIKSKYSYDDVKLVSSRVISAGQIRADF